MVIIPSSQQTLKWAIWRQAASSKTNQSFYPSRLIKTTAKILKEVKIKSISQQNLYRAPGAMTQEWKAYQGCHHMQAEQI